MNRRGFLVALAGAGTTIAFPRTITLLDQTVAQGYRPAGRGDVPFTQMEIRIGRHVTERVAENERRRILAAPVNEPLGEFYPGSPVEQELPDELAGIGQVVRYSVVAGVAAAKSMMLMGTFRIGQLMWMIDGRNAQLDIVTDLASQIADVINADGVDRFHTAASLRTLLPVPDDFPVDVELADVDGFMFRFGL